VGLPGREPPTSSFLGTDRLTVAIPLKTEATSGRPVVAQVGALRRARVSFAKRRRASGGVPLDA
jgi:hypothetical protein